MLKRAEYPAGIPCWIVLAQRDPEAAARFYEAVLGWTFERRADGGYLIASLHGVAVAAIASPPLAPGDEPQWHTYVSVDSADAAAATVTAAGGSLIAPPFDLPDEDARVASCADPSGAVFGVWEPRRCHGAELVNEPGTWNWSSLTTPDPDRAKAFYGTVFGWEASSFAPGADNLMWRRPGYADFLESINPGIRALHAGMGAPEGFTEAIGWMSGAPETSPAQWSVTFAVADVPEFCARTRESGGAVIDGPVVAGVVTTAVLRDPSGATFNVNSFNPR